MDWMRGHVRNTGIKKKKLYTIAMTVVNKPWVRESSSHPLRLTHSHSLSLSLECVLSVDTVLRYRDSLMSVFWQVCMCCVGCVCCVYVVSVCTTKNLYYLLCACAVWVTLTLTHSLSPIHTQAQNDPAVAMLSLTMADDVQAAEARLLELNEVSVVMSCVLSCRVVLSCVWCVVISCCMWCRVWCVVLCYVLCCGVVSLVVLSCVSCVVVCVVSCVVVCVDMCVVCCPVRCHVVCMSCDVMLPIVCMCMCGMSCVCVVSHSLSFLSSGSLHSIFIELCVEWCDIIFLLSLHSRCVSQVEYAVASWCVMTSLPLFTLFLSSLSSLSSSPHSPPLLRRAGDPDSGVSPIQEQVSLSSSPHSLPLPTLLLSSLSSSPQ